MVTKGVPNAAQDACSLIAKLGSGEQQSVVADMYLVAAELHSVSGAEAGRGLSA